MQKVRWGLVSTALINEQVIPAIQLSSRSELSAIASRDLARSNDYAQKWSIPHAFGSYQEMYDLGEVDAVYISLPNHMHAEWTIRALAVGHPCPVRETLRHLTRRRRRDDSGQQSKQ